MDAWRAAVVIEAKSFLGTPWHHRGRVKGAGIDCAQLLIEVYSAAGVIKRFDSGEYPPDYMLHSRRELFLEWVEKYMDSIEHPGMGDVVLWRFGHTFSHAGIVIDWPQFIHAYRPERAVVYGDDRDKYLNQRERRFYTPKAVTP